MGNEKAHKALSSDPRIYQFGGFRNWEEGVEDEDGAKLRYEALQMRLEKVGATIPADAKILEIGSGSGVFLRYLQKLGLDAVGVDARPRGEKTRNVVRARIEQLPFPDKSFGLVFSSAVFDSELYHQNQLAMIEEIVRVLKHGGIYFGILNDKETPFEEYFEVLESDASIGIGLYRKK